MWPLLKTNLSESTWLLCVLPAAELRSVPIVTCKQAALTIGGREVNGDGKIQLRPKGGAEKREREMDAAILGDTLQCP